MEKLSTNPLLFKINYINGDQFETAGNVSGVLGTAFHNAMEVYYGGSDTLVPTSEAEAIEYGLRVGMEFIENYNDGFINYSKTIPNKQKLSERFAFCFNSYVTQMPYKADKVFSVEGMLKETIDVEWHGERLRLPVPLKGKVDRIDREDGKLRIIDYKTCYQFSSPDKIDGAKILQAVVYYLLAYAAHGEEPHSVTFQEVKYTKNSDGTKQVREYEMIFTENPLYFDFFFRFYEDMTKALNGEMVYLPNVRALFDNEISLIAYIHRLDISEEVAKQMKKLKVTNITDLLKKEMQGAGNMRKLMKAVEQQFSEAKNIDYTKMQSETKIQTKLMEHGMMLSFDSVVEGKTVDLYRFNPSIGIKMSKVRSYSDDVAQVLGVSGVRILAPVPNTTFVGFEVPKLERQFNGKAPKSQDLVVPIGTDIQGEIVYVDIRTAPHILMAGATGGGKSVAMCSILDSLDGQVDFWLADPKGVELNHYTSKKYAEEPEDIRRMLEQAVDEMDKRYAIMKKKGLRMWDGKVIVLAMDEFGDFMLSNPEGAKEQKYYTWTKSRLYRECKSRQMKLSVSDLTDKDVMAVLLEEHDKENRGKYADFSGEELMLKLSQKARAAGIHMIIATQSPRADIVTGRIKANFPTRIALATKSELESRIILDQTGAEKLLGKGDALVLKSDSADLVRVQSFNI